MAKKVYRVITTSLDRPGEDYLEVMQDLYVEKTGRFELIDKKLTTDPLNGGVIATIEVVETEQKTDDGL